MFHQLKNLYEAEYVLESTYNLSILEAGDRVARVQGSGFGVRCAKLKGGTLPPGFTLDGSTGDITLTDPDLARNPASGVQASAYPLQIATFDFSGGCTWHDISLQFQVGVPATLTPGTLYNHIGDYQSTTVPLYTFNDGDGLLDVQLKNQTQLPPGLRFHQATTPGPVEIRVDNPALLRQGSYDFEVCAVDVNGYQTPFSLSIAFQDEHPATLTWEALRSIDRYETATASNPIRLALIEDADDRGIAALSFRGVDGSPLNLSDFGLDHRITSGATPIGEIRVVDGVVFTARIAAEFIHDAAEGSYAFPFSVATIDGKGGQRPIEAQLTLKEMVSADIRTFDPDFSKTYTSGDTLAVISGTTGGAITGYTEPSTNYLSDRGLTATVDKGLLLLQVGDPVSNFLDFDGNGWSTADTEGLRTLAVGLTANDAAGNTLAADVALSIYDFETTRLAHSETPKALAEYVQGDVLGRVYDLISGPLSNPSTPSVNLATLGLNLIVEQTEGQEGTVALVIDNLSTFQRSIPTQFSLSATDYSRTITIRATHPVTGTVDSDLLLEISAQNVDSMPEVVLPEVRRANEYQKDDLVASVVEVIDGGVRDISVDSDHDLDQLGLALTIDHKRIARLKVEDSIVFQEAVQAYFEYENGQYTYTLSATVTDMMRGVAEVDIQLVIGDENTPAIVALDKAKYVAEYTEVGEVLASITDAGDGGIVTSTTDTSLLAQLSISMAIEAGGIVRFKVIDPVAFRTAVQEPTYQLIPGYFRKAFNVTTTDSEGGQTVSEVAILVRSDAFVDSKAVVENQPSGVVPGDLVAGYPVITFSDADGKLDPALALLKNTQGIVVDPGLVGLAFAANTANNLHLDLVIGSGANAAANYLAALGQSGSRAFKVCLFDPFNLETELSIALAVQNDQPAIAIEQFDPPEHENKLPNNSVLFQFRDPDNSPASVNSLVWGTNSFTASEAGLQITSDHELAIQTQLEFQARLHASNTVWSLNTDETEYHLDVNVVTTDQNGKTTNLTVTAKVRKDLESQLIEDYATPLHQGGYPGGTRLFAFTDEDNGLPTSNISTLAEKAGNGFSLSEAGLSINSQQEIVLTTNLNDWYNKLKTGPYTLVGNEHRLSFSVTTFDLCNGQTDHDLLFRVVADRPSDWVLPHPDPKNIDAYRDGDPLATIEDPDGLIYDGAASPPNIRVYRTDNGNEVTDLGLAGLTFEQLDPNTVAVKVADASNFVNTTGVSITYRFDIYDDEGGFTSLNKTFTTIADSEAYPEVVTKHEAEYRDTETVVVFRDTPSVQSSVVNSPANLANYGLAKNSNGIRLNGTVAEFRDKLKNGPYSIVNIGGLDHYRVAINVSTTDESGGKSTFGFNFDVQKDRPAQYFGDENISRNEDAFKELDELFYIQDRDGLGQPSYTEALRLFQGSGPGATEMSLSDAGLQFRVINAVAVRIRIIDIDDFRLANNGLTEYFIRVKDNKGGETDLPFSIEMVDDREAGGVVNKQYVGAYKTGDPVVTYSDPDTLSTLTINSPDISTLGLTQNGFVLEVAADWDTVYQTSSGIGITADDTRFTMIDIGGIPYARAVINASTTDLAGGETKNFDVNLDIRRDRPSFIADNLTGVSKVIDAYSEPEEICVLRDLDGLTYEEGNNTTIFLRLNNSAASATDYTDPASIGLRFIPIDSTSVRLRLENLTFFRQAFTGLEPMTFVVIDDLGAQTEMDFSIEVTTDNEATANFNPKHELLYIDDESVITFTDDDGPVTGLTVNSPDLSSLGLIRVGTAIHIDGSADTWRSGLKGPGYTEVPFGNHTRYQAAINVTTVDNNGGSSTFSFDFQVRKDAPPRIFGPSTVLINEDQVQLNQDLILLDDRDGINYNPATNTGGIKLYKIDGADETLTVPDAVGLRFVRINAIAFRLRVWDVDDYKTFHAGDVDYRIEVTDNATAVDSLYITLGVIPDVELQADVVTQHEFAYTDYGDVVLFSDTPQLSSLDLDATALANLGLVQDGFKITLGHTAAIWRNDYLNNTNYNLVGSVPDQFYEATVTASSEDQGGGQSTESVLIRIRKDQPSKIISGPVAPKNEDDYRDGDVLLTFGDTDKVNYPIDSTAIILLDAAGQPIANPQSIGLRFQEVSDTVFQLRVATAGTYTTVHASERDYRIQVKDIHNSVTSTLPFSLSVTADRESSANRVIQHENLYGDNEVIVTFTDDDAPVTGLTINSPSLSTLGLRKVGTTIQIDGSAAAWRGVLKGPNYTEVPAGSITRYKAPINVTTVDSNGGSSTYSFNVEVQKDRSPNLIGPSDVTMNEDQVSFDLGLTSFEDPDGITYDPNTNVGGLKLFRGTGPDETQVVPDNMGLRFVSVDATTFQLKIWDVVKYRNNHTGTVNYRIEITDNATAVKSLNITLGVTLDNELQANVITQHAFAYADYGDLVLFSDNPQLSSLDLDATALANLGLVQDGFKITLGHTASVWRNSYLNTSNYTLAGTAPNQFYEATITASSEDQGGGLSTESVVIRIRKDQAVKTLSGPAAPKNEDDYRDGDLLLTFEDTDRVNYPADVTAILLLDASGQPIGNPQSIGLRFQEVSDTVFQLRVATAGTFTTVHASERDYRIQVKDIYNAVTSTLPFSLSVTADREASANPVIQHENLYGDNEVIVTFTDDDAPVTGLTINSPSLSSLGLRKVGTTIQIDGSAETWRGVLKGANYTEVNVPGYIRYRAPVNVTTEDNNGGRSTFSFNVEVQKDFLPRLFTPSTVVLNEDEVKFDLELALFDDRDGITYNPATNTGGLKLYRQGGPDETLVVPDDEGLRFVAVNANTFRLKIWDEGKYKTKHTGSVNYRIEVTDGATAVKSINLTLGVTPDIELQVNVITLHEYAYADYGDVVLFSDTPQLSSLDLDATALSNLGLVQNGFKITLGHTAAFWRDNYLNTSNYTLVGSAPNQFYEAAITASSEDQGGGQSTEPVVIRIRKDQPVKITSGPILPKNEDDYRDGDLLLTFTDTDRVNYPTDASAIQLLNAAGQTISNPPGIGLRFQKVSDTVFELRVASAGTYTAVHANEQDYQIQVKDIYNAVTTDSFSLSVVSDNELQYSTVRKHQNNYANNENVIFFSDSDGGLLNLTISDAILDSYGLVQNGFNVRVDGIAQNLISKLSNYTLIGTAPNQQYRANIPVTSEDNNGGKSTDTVTFLIDKDKDAVQVPPSLVAKTESSYLNGQTVVHFYDADNPGGANSANVSSITWRSTFTAASLGLQVQGAEIRVISTTALQDSLRNPGSAWNYNSGKFRVLFQVSTFDQYGGETDHTVTFEVLHENRPARATPSAFPEKRENLFSNGEVLLAFTDDDNPGDRKVTRINWNNTFTPEQAGMRIDNDSMTLRLLTVNEFRAALRASGPPYTFNPSAQQFQTSINLSTEDQFGQTTPFTGLAFNVDFVNQDAIPVYPGGTPKFEDQYGTNEVVVHFYDSDNPGAVNSANVSSASWVTGGFSASDAGLKVENGAVKVISYNALRTALRSGSPYTHDGTNFNLSFTIRTFDQYGGFTNHPINLSIIHRKSAAQKSPPNIAVKNQDAWNDGDLLHSFTDADNQPGVAPDLTWDAGNLPTLNATGLTINGQNELRIKTRQDLKNAIDVVDSPYQYDADEKQYYITFNLTTTDQFGGTTPHSISFRMDEDEESTSYNELGRKIYGFHNNDTVFIAFTDANGPLAASNAQLFAADALDTPLDLSNEGFRWVENGNDLELRPMLNNGTRWATRITQGTSKDFVAILKDPFGGTTTHNFTLSFAASDRVATYSTVEKHERNYDNEANNNLPIITFSDEDGIDWVSYRGSVSLSDMGMVLVGNEVRISSLNTFQSKVDDPPFAVNGSFYQASLPFDVLDNIGVLKRLDVLFRVVRDRAPSVSPTSVTLNESEVATGRSLVIFTDPDTGMVANQAVVTNSSGTPLTSPSNQAFRFVSISGSPNPRLRLEIDKTNNFNSLVGAGNSVTFGARLTDNYGGVKASPNFTITVNAAAPKPQERDPIPTPEPVNAYSPGFIVTTIELPDGRLLPAKTFIQGISPLVAADLGMRFEQNADGDAIDLVVTDRQKFADAFNLATELELTLDLEDADAKVYEFTFTIIAAAAEEQPIITVDDNRDKSTYRELDTLILITDDFREGIESAEITSPNETALSDSGLELTTDTDPASRLELRIPEGRLQTFVESFSPDNFWTEGTGSWSYTFRISVTNNRGESYNVNQEIVILDPEAGSGGSGDGGGGGNQQGSLLVTPNHEKDKQEYRDRDSIIHVRHLGDLRLFSVKALTPDEDTLSQMGLEFNFNTDPSGNMELRIPPGASSLFQSRMRPGGFWDQIPGGWQFTFRFDVRDEEGRFHPVTQTITIYDAGG